MLSFHCPKARDEEHPSGSDRNFGRGTYPFVTKLQHSRCRGRKGEQHRFYQATSTSVKIKGQLTLVLALAAFYS